MLAASRVTQKKEDITQDTRSPGAMPTPSGIHFAIMGKHASIEGLVYTAIRYSPTELYEH